MPLEMNQEVFITCAVTGSGSTQDRSHHVPRSPEQIANAAIDAAKAGAARRTAIAAIPMLVIILFLPGGKDGNLAAIYSDS